MVHGKMDRCMVMAYFFGKMVVNMKDNINMDVNTGLADIPMFLAKYMKAYGPMVKCMEKVL